MRGDPESLLIPLSPHSFFLQTVVDGIFWLVYSKWLAETRWRTLGTTDQKCRIHTWRLWEVFGWTIPLASREPTTVSTIREITPRVPPRGGVVTSKGCPSRHSVIVKVVTVQTVRYILCLFYVSTSLNTPFWVWHLRTSQIFHCTIHLYSLSLFWTYKVIGLEIVLVFEVSENSK